MFAHAYDPNLLEGDCVAREQQKNLAFQKWSNYYDPMGLDQPQ